MHSSSAIYASANLALNQPTSNTYLKIICKITFWQFPIKKIKHVMPEILSCTSQDLLCCYIKDMNGYFIVD